MASGFKLTIKKKSLPTRPLNVRVQAVPDSGDIPTMGSSGGGGGAAPSTPAGGLPSSAGRGKEKSFVKKISGPRGQYK
jgi:hypothetical protein